MGVPKFFAWLMRKYKKSNFIFQKEKTDLEDINWFLIDTNCLIHPTCFKILAEEQSKENINFKSLENKMINAVLEYIEKLITYINPTIGCYISIDGPVCCAKMKQQRQRRFRSVYDKELFDKIKIKYKQPIPYYWNNSAISPGTKFMDKLHNKILIWANKYAKKTKIKIIYSSSNVPGEGEHKLLDFIKNNYKYNYSYVTYGLDADLIFLMLVTNSEKVYLLREAQQFDSSESQDKLNFVSLKIMRECIYESFKKEIDIKSTNINIDKNKIIKDFIFLCYFLGNDFLPHILSLDISKNGIEYIIEKYIDTFLIKYNYILNENEINQDFLKLFLENLAKDEESILIKNFAKSRKYANYEGKTDYEKEICKIDNLLFKIPDKIGIGVNSNYRINYYKHNFKLDDDEIENFVENLVKNYLIGIKWVTKYYFEKIPDWSWYYPYDYPPFISDISKYLIKFNKIQFKEGKHMTPFEQLLNILPPQSAKYLLPNNLVKLTSKCESSLIHLYPTHIDVDFLYKHKFWEGIPKLPPMETKLIKYVYSKYKNEIDEKDLIRNRIENDIIIG